MTVLCDRGNRGRKYPDPGSSWSGAWVDEPPQLCIVGEGWFVISKFGLFC